MQYLLSDDEYRTLYNKSKALDEIRAIIDAEPEDDEHGNSKPYAYRFDKTMSRIRKALDGAEVMTMWKMPWGVAK